MSAACIVAADVGNSALKLCVRRSDQPGQDDHSLIDHAISIADASWHGQAIEWVQGQLGCQTMHWRIASVHRFAVHRLQQAISDTHPSARIEQLSRHDVPLKTQVHEPDVLGIDRLLSAFAASNRFSVPLIVIDAGSAVTVDLVSHDREFVGGAILPGLSLQTRSLATGTDSLPHVNRWNADDPLPSPGQNTADAIRLGVLLGLAGAVDRIVASYQELQAESPQNCPVVLTGGDAATLSPILRFPHEIVPNLVCRGLLDLPRSGEPQIT